MAASPAALHQLLDGDVCGDDRRKHTEQDDGAAGDDLQARELSAAGPIPEVRAVEDGWQLKCEAGGA